MYLKTKKIEQKHKNLEMMLKLIFFHVQVNGALLSSFLNTFI